MKIFDSKVIKCLVFAVVSVVTLPQVEAQDLPLLPAPFSATPTLSTKAKLSLKAALVVKNAATTTTSLTGTFPDVSTAPPDLFGTLPQDRVGIYIYGLALSCPSATVSDAQTIATNASVCDQVNYINTAGVQSGHVEYYSWPDYNAYYSTLLVVCVRGDGAYQDSLPCLQTKTTSIDLSVSNIQLTQPAGQSPVNGSDSSGLPLIAPGFSGQAAVAVGASGVDASNSKSTTVTLMLGNLSVGSAIVQLSTLAGGSAVINIPFSIPAPDRTSASQVAALSGNQYFVAIINSDNSIQESNTANNSHSTAIDIISLCNVADSGRVVPFQSQVYLGSDKELYAHSPTKTMHAKGCATSALSMLANSYGIKTSSSGSALTPSTLNADLKKYGVSSDAPSGLGYLPDPSNAVSWIGSVNALRSNYSLACAKTSSADLCDANSKSKISFKSISSYDRAKVNSEICSGNPVIVQVMHNGGPHFVLVKGNTIARSGREDLVINDPGKALGESTNLADQYASGPISYRLFKDAADPSMFFTATSENVEFVITDPEGRRAGFNPLTNQTYTEIPGAIYLKEGVDDYDDLSGANTPMANVLYNYTDVPNGEYQVALYSKSGGAYWVQTDGFDANGTFNGRSANSGTIKAGGSTALSFNHTDISLPQFNSSIILKAGHVHGDVTGKNSHFFATGKLSAPNVNKILLAGVLRVTLGGDKGIFRTVDLGSAIKLPFTQCLLFSKAGLQGAICQSGDFWLHGTSLDLSSVPQENRGQLELFVSGLRAQTKLRFLTGQSCNLKDSDF